MEFPGGFRVLRRQQSEERLLTLVRNDGVAIGNGETPARRFQRSQHERCRPEGSDQKSSALASACGRQNRDDAGVAQDGSQVDAKKKSSGLQCRLFEDLGKRELQVVLAERKPEICEKLYGGTGEIAA